MKTPACFICSIKTEQDGGNGSELCSKSVFWKFAKDYLEIEETGGGDCDSGGPKCLCECCTKTVESISQLYLELLGLQLRISWKMGELGKLLQSSATAYHDDNQFIKAMYIKCAQKGTEKMVLEHGMIPFSDEEVNIDAEVETESVYDPGEERNDFSSECDDDDDEEHSSSARKTTKVGSKEYSCSKCGKSCSSQRSLTAHMRNSHKPPETCFCSHCNKKYVNIGSLKSHLKDHHNPFPCSFCGETLFGNIAHYAHMLNSHLEECNHPCPTCGAIFASKYRLNQHVRKTHTSLRFPCHLCNVEVKCKASLKEHLAAVHNPTLNICPHCGKTFYGSVRYLSVYISEVHPEVAPPSTSHKKRHQCPTCGEWFRRRILFERHVLECNPTKAGEVMRECKICGKPMGIYDARKMERHLATHMNAEEKKQSGEKPKAKQTHLCDTCGREFRNKVTYVAHCSTHKGEKGKFVCDKCPTAFHLKSGLKRHILRVHLNIKAPRKQERTTEKDGNGTQDLNCQKQFKIRSNLMKHLRVDHNVRKERTKIKLEKASELNI